MLSKIKTYLNDAVDGVLIEPVATNQSGKPTGNLTESEMQNIREMKKRFKESTKTQSKGNANAVTKKSSRPLSPSKKTSINKQLKKTTTIVSVKMQTRNSASQDKSQIEKKIKSVDRNVPLAKVSDNEKESVSNGTKSLSILDESSNKSSKSGS